MPNGWRISVSDLRAIRALDVEFQLERELVANNRVVKDHEFTGAWGMAHPWCMICGGPEGYGIAGRLETHHIFGGKYGRSDEAANYLRVHNHPCHRLCELEEIKSGPYGLLPVIPIGMQLSIKRERDPADWNPKVIKRLAIHAVPDFEPIHAYWKEQWDSNEHSRLMLGWTPPPRSENCKLTLRLSCSAYTRLKLKAKAHNTKAATLARELIEGLMLSDEQHE
jgi:hypothetical protein